MSNYVVVIDRDLCIGAGSCVAIAPLAFALDNEAKAILLPTSDTSGDDLLLEAAKACPVAAITITDKAGKTLFP